MNEEQFGRRVAWHLDRGLCQLDQGTLNALAAARNAALSCRSAYQISSEPASAAVGRGNELREGRHTRVRWWLPVSAVALASAALIYVQTVTNQRSVFTPNHDVGTLDAGLLADDLPIDAYLDKGFDAWLEDTSE